MQLCSMCELHLYQKFNNAGLSSMHGVKLSGTVTSVEACGDYQVHIMGGENVV